MNKPKCDEYDCINFLIATQRIYSCTSSKSSTEKENVPAHDSFIEGSNNIVA